MLTDQQIAEFNRCGVLRLPGATATSAARAMRAEVWGCLERRYPFRHGQPQSWTNQRLYGLHALEKSVTFDQVGSPAVCRTLDQVLGQGNWQRPVRWASILVAFPESRDRWDVPHASWHLDLPAPNSPQGMPLVRLFTCLASLEHGGGGTVMLAGSHLLVDQIARKSTQRLRSAEIRKTLIRQHSWLKALCSNKGSEDRANRFMNVGSTVNGVHLRVLEMTGDPGDVFLMHPLTLHAPSTNCAAVPRIVLSTFIYRNESP
jgi:hypothetical protein